MNENVERDVKILNWNKAKWELDRWKDEEMRLRKEIAKMILGEERPEAYSETLELGQGYRIKATNVINYTLDAVERVEEVVNKLSEIDESETARDIFKWKPSLSESAYKKLSPELKTIVDEVVSIKIGAPKVEFIEPKVKP